MKKILLILVSVVAVAVIIAIALFPKTVSGGIGGLLRGLKPSLEKPPEDIAKLVGSGTAPLVFPHGFSIGVFATGLEAPRVLAADPNGVLLASIPKQGRVVALPDANQDGVADRVVTVVEGLNRPHGLAFSCEQEKPCKLYIAETNAVAVYTYDAKEFRASQRRKLLDLPGGGNHFTRTILMKDGKLYISVGSSCNVCKEKDSRRAKILVSDLDGKNLKPYATGLRNAVFMTTHPKTGKLWVTEMGRDLLGDDLPPDEINIVNEGKFYGWPFCYGKRVWDRTFDRSELTRKRCEVSTPSLIDLPAHSAPLGLAFVGNDPAWQKQYRNNLFVAYHGSWNRSEPTGYKVVRFRFGSDGKSLDAGKAQDFITGWLTKEGKALGRPVDILVRPGGVLYISDDKAGVIYRVRAPFDIGDDRG